MPFKPSFDLFSHWFGGPPLGESEDINTQVPPSVAPVAPPVQQGASVQQQVPPTPPQEAPAPAPPESLAKPEPPQGFDLFSYWFPDIVEEAPAPAPVPEQPVAPQPPPPDPSTMPFMDPMGMQQIQQAQAEQQQQPLTPDPFQLAAVREAQATGMLPPTQAPPVIPPQQPAAPPVPEPAPSPLDTPLLDDAARRQIAQIQAEAEPEQLPVYPEPVLQGGEAVDPEPMDPQTQVPGMSPTDALAILEAGAREEKLQEIEASGPLNRAAGAFSAKMVDSPIGLIANTIKKALPGTPEEAEKLSQLWLDAKLGPEGTLGKVGAFVVPPVLDILATKGLAGSLAPRLTTFAPKVSKFLNIVAQDPGKLIGKKEYANVLRSLVGEELSFIAGDVVAGSDLPTMLANMGIGIVAGGGIEGLMAGAGRGLVKGSVPTQPNIMEDVDALVDLYHSVDAPEVQGEIRGLLEDMHGEDVTNSLLPPVKTAEDLGIDPLIEGEESLGSAFRDLEGNVHGPRPTHAEIETDTGTKLGTMESEGQATSGFLLEDPGGNRRFLTREEMQAINLPSESTQVMESPIGGPMRRAFEDTPDDKIIQEFDPDAGVRTIEADEEIPDFEALGREYEEGLEAPGGRVRPEDAERLPEDPLALEEPSAISKNMQETLPERPPPDPQASAKALDDIESPDERHSMGYFMIEDVIDDLARTDLGRLFRRKLGMAGDVPEKVFDQKVRQDNELKGRLLELRIRHKRAVDMVSEEYGPVALRDLEANEDLWKEMMVAVGSEQEYRPDMGMPRELFAELRGLQQMSKVVSSTFLGEGLAGGQLKASMTERMGMWLARTYRRFEPPVQGKRWRPNEEQVNHARAWASDHYGLDDDQAAVFVSKVLDGEFADALDEIQRTAKRADRARLRSLGAAYEEEGSTRMLSGFVPGNLRKELGTITGLRRNEVDKLVDDFIGHEPDGGFKLIDEIKAARERLENKYRLEVEEQKFVDDLYVDRPKGREGGVAPEELDKIRQRISRLNELEDNLYQRREIPEEIRAVLGEETNPLVRIAQTIERGSVMLGQARVARTVIEEGHTLGFVRNRRTLVDAADADDYVSLTAKDRWLTMPDEVKFGDAMRPLQDIKVHKDYLEALENRFNRIRPDISGGYKMILGLNHLVKGNLTFRNPGTHGRNFFGASMFAAAGGLVHPFNIPTQMKRLAKAADVASKATSFRADKLANADIAQVRRMFDLGLLDSSVLERGFADNLQEMAEVGNLSDWSTQFREKNIVRKAGDELMDWDNKAREVYRMEDDIARVVVYMGELDELEKAYQKAGKKISREALEERAARIARDTYPNYDLLPTAIQDLRRNPIFSSFPSFAWETMRVAKNQIKMAGEELSDPILRARGMKRTAGIIQTMLVPSVAAGMMGKFACNMSSEELDALRRDQGDYQKYNTIVPLHRKPDGSVFYVDLGYTDVFNIFRSTFFSLADGLEREGMLGEAGNIRSAFERALAEGADPFAQEEILFGLMVRLLTNQDQWGHKVYDDNTMYRDMAGHIFRSLEPGIVKTGRRTAAAVRGDYSSNLARPPVAAEAAEAIGFRIRLSNPKKEFEWRLGRTRANLVAADDDLMRMAMDVNLTGEEEYEKLEAEYTRFEQDRKEALLDGIIATHDSRLRRNPEGNVRRSIEEMGLDKSEDASLVKGLYLPKTFGRSFLTRLKKQMQRQTLTREEAIKFTDMVDRRIAILRGFSGEYMQDAPNQQYVRPKEGLGERLFERD